MLFPLVECIPNFSEARRQDVVDAIQQSIQKVPNVYVLDRHSDTDHNRTVITFVGSPSAVEEAAFQAIATAARLIDLNLHTGEHPRIGATDVVPFVPIYDVSMQECVEMARRLGRRVAEELEIPVYLYEEAATREDRRNLENIRRGEYEGLRVEITDNPDRVPDFGPCQLGPAGATVIGARQPLIAFNVYLNTDDVSIAQKIARAVRNSSGGLHYVKALGVLVGGRAQVSMNLTNFRQTTLERVVEMVRREAARYGTTIHHSELVGLIPQEALINAAVWYLQLDSFEPSQILEYQLQKVLKLEPQQRLSDQRYEFLNELATGKPTPAGGSASAYAGAAAAALVAMAARITLQKKNRTSVSNQLWEIIEQAEALRSQLISAITRDAEAYQHYLQVLKRSKEVGSQIEYTSAILEIIRVPLEVAQRTIEVLEMIVRTAAICLPAVLGDLGSAMALARSALIGAGINIRENVKLFPEDFQYAQSAVSDIRNLESRFLGLEKQIKSILQERGNLTLPDIL
ncbi:MAG: glutamate formimidoyltransferase [Anaerolineales bacterium]